MRKLIVLLLVFSCFSLLGVTHVKAFKNYTFSDSICKSFHIAAYDTNEFIIPRADTTIVTTYTGKIDTNITFAGVWPSLFEQQSQEAVVDTGIGYLTFDRWSMENWAFALYLANAGGDANDSIGAEVLYSFDRSRWTVPYTLVTKTGTKGTLLTYYPLDLYDNWKLYRYAKLRIFSYSKDSSYVNVWMVGRIKDLISGE